MSQWRGWLVGCPYLDEHDEVGVDVYPWPCVLLAYLDEQDGVAQ